MAQTHLIDSHGAQLHVKVVGNGAPVVISQGGIGDADTTSDLADILAEAGCQVITYDRRGLGRSTTTAPQDVSIALHAQDLAAVASAIAHQPVHVTGSSIGALIALQFALDYSDIAASVTAHEPPLAAVLVDEQRVAELDAIAELAKTDVKAAIGRMARLTPDPDPEQGITPRRSGGDLDANLRNFFEHDFPAVRSAAVTAKDVTPIVNKLTLTAGEASTEGWEHRCAHQLATETGAPFVLTPGGHGPLTTHPRAYSALLLRVINKQEQ